MADLNTYAESERRSKEEVRLAHNAIQKVRENRGMLLYDIIYVLISVACILL